ncbi:hypothetical protein OOK41_29880 [Micromonospora sp. NBC_01655]|nr:hypothetical protein [Micromonospora sp. NBC_01655]MCX4474470.1 hypothetical protein [Micromonospora sp. NBC_01655]
MTEGSGSSAGDARRPGGPDPGSGPGTVGRRGDTVPVPDGPAA